jgi:hypothetical protein
VLTGPEGTKGIRRLVSAIFEADRARNRLAELLGLDDEMPEGIASRTNRLAL